MKAEYKEGQEASKKFERKGVSQLLNIFPLLFCWPLFQFLIFPDFKKGLFSGSGPGGRRFKSSLPDHFESMTSGRFRGTRKPPPWAALRAGRIREPSRMAFWCDIFLSRDSMSLAENPVLGDP